ncbi:MAG: phosphoesterase [Legionellales bacterium]|nr:phosphoesterase [Legionellales bacterium]OUX63763.1 MAG: hypothetical protein CBE41_04505 [Gammaproteobacteria bacterium TMED281]|tara:strand:+ start:188 stop:628 length:441 start_codon:yes stop_codon:yes gene_type:complete
MVDMSYKGSHQYWSKFMDPSVYRVITFMEAVEDWTLDGDIQVDKGIERLGELLSQVDVTVPDAKPEIIKLIAYIKTSRNLRFLQALDQIKPGSASKVISYAEENQFNDHHSYIFIYRNIIFERLRILNRIFQKERISIVKKGYETI